MSHGVVSPVDELIWRWLFKRDFFIGFSCSSCFHSAWHMLSKQPKVSVFFSSKLHYYWKLSTPVRTWRPKWWLVQSNLTTSMVKSEISLPPKWKAKTYWNLRVLGKNWSGFHQKLGDFLLKWKLFLGQWWFIEHILGWIQPRMCSLNWSIDKFSPDLVKKKTSFKYSNHGPFHFQPCQNGEVPPVDKLIWR